MRHESSSLHQSLLVLVYVLTSERHRRDLEVGPDLLGEAAKSIGACLRPY